jgi:hypothetical protein
MASNWARRATRKTGLEPNYVCGCPSCFGDEGLRLLAVKTSIEMSGVCPNCGNASARKLRLSELQYILHTFFIWGTYQRPEYGAFPAVQANEHQTTSIKFSDWLEPDVRLFEKWFKVGFFHYGPRAWMYGRITPLEGLQDPEQSVAIIERVIGEYPVVQLQKDTVLYRIRKQPKHPNSPAEYDSPPNVLSGSGRLDSSDLSIMYASSDLQICIHECRVTAEDDTYVATLTPARELRLLDLTEVLREDSVSEFESLDLAIHMLFLAGAHSYQITRAIAKRARAAGFDGLIYPSFFSLQRTGAMPLMTTYGISHRRIGQMQPTEKQKIVPNVAIFGHPIADGILSVKSLNRLMIHAVEYHTHFGPVEYN